MNTTKRQLTRLADWAILVLPGCVSAMAVYATCQPSPPSDASLERLFRQHRAEFETIRRMAKQEHGMQTIALSFSQPNRPASFTPEREEEYRRLFREVGASRIDFQENEDWVEFSMWGAGLAISGLHKSIGYTDQVPDELVVRETAQEPYRRGCVVRLIEGNWYITFCSH